MNRAPSRQRLTLGLALLASVILGAPVAALAGGYAGYEYGGTATPCPVACDGVRVTFEEPLPIYNGKNGETADVASTWVGIQGNVHGTQCTLGSGNNNPLMQFGTEPQISSVGVQTHRIWWQVYPCNTLVYPTQTVAISAGDTITLEQVCITNCTTGTSSQVWRFTWTNVTTGQSQTMTQTGWIVWMDIADAVIEPQPANATDSTSLQPASFSPIKFYNVEIHQSGAWLPMPIKPISPSARYAGAWLKVKTTPSWIQSYTTSIPVDSGRTSFYVCSQLLQTTSTLGQPCLASSYSGTAGLGP